MRRLLAHGIALLVLAGVGLQVAANTGTLSVWALPILFLELITLVVGWLLAWKRPRIPLGWILIAITGSFVLWSAANALGALLLPTAPGLAAWAFAVGGGAGDIGVSGNWMISIGLLFTQLPLRFPTGRLPSPRWRWFSWCTIVAIPLGALLVSTDPAEYVAGVPNPIHIAWGEATPLLTAAVLGIGFAGSAIGSIVSLFVRYHRGSEIERAQLRWMFWAVAVAVGLLILSWLVSVAVGGDLAAGPLGTVSQSFSFVAGLGYCLIPLAIGFAVLRQGLYEIDRIISRTVAYALVTFVLLGAYAGLIIGVTSLLPREWGSVGIAVSTLAAAAAFLPLLRRVQGWVDRRFNRTAYDAQRVVEAFGRRLRSGADPHGAAQDLGHAIERTLQPSTVGIWTRGGAA